VITDKYGIVFSYKQSVLLKARVPKIKGDQSSP